VGLTKRGKGSKVMLVVEGQGLPLGVRVESAQKAEVRLAESSPGPGEGDKACGEAQDKAQGAGGGPGV
jgi:hypothetical protein